MILKNFSLHSSLHFTFEKELNSSLLFLNVLVEKHKTGFITYVNRKPTFTSRYVHWDSFSPIKQKINLVTILVHPAMFICSCSRLQAKLDKIRFILVAIWYPNHIIISTFSKKIRQFNQSSQHGPKKCPVYLDLPWLENVSIKFEKQITTAIQRCYFAVETRVVITTRSLLPAIKKDVVSGSNRGHFLF